MKHVGVPTAVTISIPGGFELASLLQHDRLASFTHLTIPVPFLMGHEYTRKDIGTPYAGKVFVS